MWTTSIDQSVQPILSKDAKEIVIEFNFGKGTYYPGVKKCKYHGKIVDCLTFAFESNGITGEILEKVLEYFDDIELFPCVMMI